MTYLGMQVLIEGLALAAFQRIRDTAKNNLAASVNGSAIGPTAGIALAMLGGCMWPLSIVSSSMRAIGHITPQSWAVDAWTSLLSRHGSVVTILPDLGVLAAFAAVLLSFAALRLYQRLQ